MCVNLYLQWKLRSREKEEKNEKCKLRKKTRWRMLISFVRRWHVLELPRALFTHFPNEVFRSPLNHEPLTIQLIRQARGRVRTSHESTRSAFSHWLARYYWNIKIHVINNNNSIIELRRMRNAIRRHAANKFMQNHRNNNDDVSRTFLHTCFRAEYRSNNFVYF